MLWLISYDIADDRRRNQVHETLKNHGRRVQFSVFECELTAGQLGFLRHRLEFVLDASEDSCRLYRVCQACLEETIVLGRADPPGLPDFVVI